MEKKVEHKFRDECKTLGCKVVKFRDPAQTGAPDRQVLLPDGIAVFVEIKDKGKVPRHDQIQYMLDLNRLGFLAFWADNAAEAVSVIGMVMTHTNRREHIEGLCAHQAKLLKRRV